MKCPNCKHELNIKITKAKCGYVEKIVNKSKPHKFDFEKIYSEFPKKIGKQKGLEICKRTILTEEAFDSLLKAIVRYKDHVRRERTDPKFIKHFSTFMNSWTDWASVEVGRVELKVVNHNLLDKPIDRYQPMVEDEPIETNPDKVRELIASAFGKNKLLNDENKD